MYGNNKLKNNVSRMQGHKQAKRR